MNENMDVRLPPHSKGAERAILGCLLHHPTRLPEVAMTGLRAEEFYAFAHQHIFSALLFFSEKGKAPDAVEVCEWLISEKKMDDAGGPGYLAELIDEAPTATNIVGHADVIRAFAAKRDIIHACAELQTEAFDSSMTAEEVLDSAEKRILAIGERNIVGQQVTLQEAIKESYERLDRRQNRKEIDGVPSGFVDLDTITSGFQASELIILAARPSVGKTQIGLAIAANAAASSKEPVLFVSLEQARVELSDRLLCSESRSDSHRMRRGHLNASEMTDIGNAGDALSKLPLIFDDTSSQGMLRIAAGARRLKQQKGLRMIVIDYLQLIDPDDKRANRQEQVGAISRRLKMLARELKVPVLALAQLNRGVEDRAGGRPRLSDLRESGSIEQDADTVILMHRQTMDDSQIAWPIDLIVAKHRNGPTGELTLLYIRNQMRFENFAVDHSGKDLPP